MSQNDEAAAKGLGQSPGVPTSLTGQPACSCPNCNATTGVTDLELNGIKVGTVVRSNPPLSAPTNTDELEEIMVDFAKLVIEYGRKSDLKPYLEGFDTAKAAIRRLIALKQREAIIQFLKSSDNVSRDELLAELNTIIESSNGKI